MYNADELKDFQSKVVTELNECIAKFQPEFEEIVYRNIGANTLQMGNGTALLQSKSGKTVNTHHKGNRATEFVEEIIRMCYGDIFAVAFDEI